MQKAELDFDIVVQIRRYPDLTDSNTYDEAWYTIGAIESEGGIVNMLILERPGETLRMRLMKNGIGGM